jgi:hypothetical protein
MDPAYGRNDHKDRHCQTQDTEILTKSGWKRYDEVVVGDEAVCFDLLRETYSYGAISDVIVKDHDGDMYHFTSKGLDSLVTAEHRVVSRNYRVLRDGRKQDWRFYTAREIATAGRSVREIPAGGAPSGEGVKDLSLDLCRAIGWVMTDGHMSASGGVRPYIVLNQALHTNKGGVDVADVMKEVFSRLCPNATVRDYAANETRGAWRTIRVGVDETEAVFSPWISVEHNRLPREILENGSFDQLEALFLGIAEGDGSWTEKWGWIKISPGLDENFADDVQELALKLGYSPTKTIQKAAKEGDRDQWIIRLSTRPAHTFEAPNVKKEHYEGKVWCVTVPTGAFVARRNGTVFVTGNCIQVFRCFADKLVQVAEFATHDMEAKHAAWVLFHLASAYKDCVVNVELGGPGQLVMTEFNHLRELLRAEMYRPDVEARKWEDAASGARWYLYHRPDSMGAGYLYNFETTWRTKAPLMHGFKGDYISRMFVIRSKALLLEMANVVSDDGEIGAPESKDENEKDDRVFAAAFAHKAWKDWVQSDMLAQGLTYERVMNEEKNPQTKVQRSIDGIVWGFLKTAAQKAEEDGLAGPPVAPWREDNGL